MSQILKEDWRAGRSLDITFSDNRTVQARGWLSQMYKRSTFVLLELKLCQMDIEPFHSKKQKAAVEELFDILSLRSNLPTSQKEYFTLLRQNYIQDHLSFEIIYRSLFTF